jgi:hypothetical protein
MSAAGGEKVGRIPEPWRLQTTLPTAHPSLPSSGATGGVMGASAAFFCKAFFLRMDVYRSTSLLDVK